MLIEAYGFLRANFFKKCLEYIVKKLCKNILNHTIHTSNVSKISLTNLEEESMNTLYNSFIP